MHNKTCFLLSYLKYGDNGAVLNCFSKDEGFQTFFAANIYAAKNKKKSYLFPLHEINISLSNKRSGSSLQNVTKIESLQNSYEYNNININSILFFIADFLQQVLREEQHYHVIYNEIEIFLDHLYSKNSNAHIAFIFTILNKQGISPLYSEAPFLQAETGTFGSTLTSKLFDEEISRLWKDYLQTDEKYDINLNRNFRKYLIESLMYYYSVHFEGFREPVSLSVIQQIYEN